MRRYLLFMGNIPSGGWNDFVGDFDSIIDAMNSAACICGSWWHIVDTENNMVVKTNRSVA